MGHEIFIITIIYCDNINSNKKRDSNLQMTDLISGDKFKFSTVLQEDIT